MKKIYKILIYICPLLITCGSGSYSRYVCNCEEMKEVRSFITDNMKGANNMSDEEMEHVIKELRRTAIKTTCPQKQVWVEVGTSRIDFEKQKADTCMFVFY